MKVAIIWCSGNQADQLKKWDHRCFLDHQLKVQRKTHAHTVHTTIILSGFIPFRLKWLYPILVEDLQDIFITHMDLKVESENIKMHTYVPIQGNWVGTVHVKLEDHFQAWRAVGAFDGTCRVHLLECYP